MDVWVGELGEETGRGKLDDDAVVVVVGETTRAARWRPTELRVPARLFESGLDIQTTMYVMS